MKRTLLVAATCMGLIGCEQEALLKEQQLNSTVNGGGGS